MTIAPAQWFLHPKGYRKAATTTWTLNPKPIEAVWGLMAPGEIAELEPGGYRRFTLTPSPRPLGAWPVTFRGPPLSTPATILEDTAVGGSSCIEFKPTATRPISDVKFSRLVLAGDDRSGIFTQKGGVKNVWWLNCRMRGKSDAYDPLWPKQIKWGLRSYDTGNWNEDGFSGGSIREEHWRYVSQIDGDHSWKNFHVRHCGRTAWQVVNRPPPDGTNPGVGNLLWENGTIEDVCLEDQGGGSAFHLAGGMPNTIATIRNVTVSLGCDSAIAVPFQKNITSAIACLDGSPTFPGGLGELHLDGFTSEVGLAYPGHGSARRPSVVGNVRLFTMKDTYFEVGPMAFQIALDIKSSCKTFICDQNSEIVGRIKYKGTEYLTWKAFKAAHPECFA